MKKTIVLAMAATVFISFTACKKSKKEEEEEIITPAEQSNLKKDVLLSLIHI